MTMLGLTLQGLSKTTYNAEMGSPNPLALFADDSWSVLNIMIEYFAADKYQFKTKTFRN